MNILALRAPHPFVLVAVVVGGYANPRPRCVDMQVQPLVLVADQADPCPSTGCPRLSGGHVGDQQAEALAFCQG